MDKEQIKQLQNDLWTSTTRAGKAPSKVVLDAIRALGKLQVEVERLKARI